MRPAQRGALALLMALVLLALMAAGALAASRNVLREWEVAGAELQGAQAFLAAESGLAWVEAGNFQALEGDLTLGGDAAVRVQARWLGRIPRPGPDPEALDDLWAWTAQGVCRAGPGLPAYRQTCLAWSASPAPGQPPGPGPHWLAWRVDRFCDNRDPASW